MPMSCVPITDTSQVAAARRTALQMAASAGLPETETGALPTGIKFPVQNGYVTISELASEGAAIGTLVLGDRQFVVQIIPGQPGPSKLEADPTAARALSQPGWH